MKRTIIAQQGEVRVYRIDAIPPGISTRVPELDKGNAIISHSESGAHHVISLSDADVIERTDDVPLGMAILYAIVRNPTALRQDSPTPHESIPLDPGSIYELRVSREYNPFLDVSRRVTD